MDACAIAAKQTAGTGDPVDVKIVSGFGNTQDFVGFDVLASDKKKNINLQKLASPRKTSEWAGGSQDLDTSIAGLQEATIPINAFWDPQPHEISVDLVYLSGSINSVRRMFVVYPACSKDKIVVQVEFEDGSHGTARVVARIV